MELSLLAVILGFILDLIVGVSPLALSSHSSGGTSHQRIGEAASENFPEEGTGRADRRRIPAGADGWNHHGCCLGTSPGGRSGASLSEICAGSHHVLLGTGETKSLKTETMKVYDALKEGDEESPLRCIHGSRT